VETRLHGRVWKFGNNVTTDHIIAVKYLGTTDSQVFADHAMETVDPNFSTKVQPGDLMVAGRNFGSGSSREQAPLGLKVLGITAILAESFARIFYRNSINIGLPVVECPGIADAVEEGETLDVDLGEGVVRLPSGEEKAIIPFAPRVLEILTAGGLIAKLKQEASKGNP
jgi:3-isopropylmalate/(R)-2-methylmalate dehydratase small subunit